MSAPLPPPVGLGRVTVAIPTRNRAAFLRECVDSVRRQTYRDVEIWIGDNASTDETPDVMRELAASDPRIRCVRHDANLGMVGNWNALLRAATGDFFLLLSDDDLLTDDALSRLVVACSRPGVTFAYAPVFVIDGGGRVVDVYRDVGPPLEPGADFIRAHLRGGRTVSVATMLYRLAPPERRELYSESVGLVCDFLLRLTLARRGDVACVPEPLGYYREHGGNETLRGSQFTASLFRVLAHPSVVAGELRPFAAQIRWYVQASASALVTRALLRGDGTAARAIIRVAAAHQSPSRMIGWFARLMVLLPLRLVIQAWWRVGRRTAARTAARVAPVLHSPARAAE